MASCYTPIVRVTLVREGSVHRHQPLVTTDASVDFFRKFFADRASDREMFVVTHLNTKNVPISVEIVTQGTLDCSLVHPREVFKAAIVAGASSIIVAHNHPSGDPTPSREDRIVVKRLKDAAEIIGISLLDSIIVGDGPDGKALSMKESGDF